jgi:hypothetical protein
MTKEFCSAVRTAVIAALISMSMTTAFAKQQCSASAPSDARGYWSWRLIDGRKCWYGGKPMLSKSSLEWSGEAATQPGSNEELASAQKEEPSDPLDSQARAIDDRETFDALWRNRVGRR